jgi:hypothetical protein
MRVSVGVRTSRGGGIVVAAAAAGGWHGLSLVGGGRRDGISVLDHGKIGRGWGDAASPVVEDPS